MSEPIKIRSLGVVLDGHALVEDFSLELKPGLVHAVVGESGSGKTLSALAVLGLLPDGATTRGLTAPLAERRKGVAMVLQEPLSALNPVLSIGDQLRETLAVHRSSADPHALLAEVGIPSPEERMKMYPHQLSGGQRQRVSIALALAASPQILIADEPTTALDASMRGVILELLRRLARERSISVWLITHDLHAVRGASDEVTVMYAGRVVEQGPTEKVLSSPRHPYTAALLAANPAATKPGDLLPALAGSVPLASEVIAGCRFHPRCARAVDQCRSDRPQFTEGLACWLPLPPGEGRGEG